MKSIAVINDFTTCEEIALGIQMPVLRDMGHRVLPIPSKLLNYPLCVDGAVALETVGFAKDMFAFIQDREEKLDAVLTGFIPSVELSAATKEFCKKQQSSGAVIFVDPVFGDNGKAYKSVKPENIEAIKDLLSVADYCFPNYTEACLLTGTVYNGLTIGDANNISYKDRNLGMTSSEARELLMKMRAFGAKTPIVTGSIVDYKDVIIFLNESDELCTVEYERIDGHLAGTGDRFAAGVAGRMLSGDCLKDAIRKTADEITARIRQK